MPENEAVECSACGNENPKGNKFCEDCGTPLKGGEILCYQCGAKIDSGAKFCTECGASMVKKDSSSVGEGHGLRWSRMPDDFAKRVDVEDLKSSFQRGIIVEEGTRALLLKNGALFASMEPGYYDMKTFMEALKDSVIKGGGAVVSGVAGFVAGIFKKEAGEKVRESVDEAVDSLITQDCTVLLIDSGDVEVKLNLTNIYTKDPFSIDISCNVVLRVQEARSFFVNVMKSSSLYRVTNLRDSLLLELQNAFNEVISQKSVLELNSDLSLKQQFENTVKEHMNKTLGLSYGLNFFQLRTIAYSFKRYNEIRKIHEEVFFQVTKEDAELQGRKRLFDVYDQKQLQEIIEETKEVEYRQKRQKVWADMRALVNSDKMNEIKSADDLEEYLHEINKGKFLREDEVQELLNTFKQSALRRDFLLEKIKLEQNLESERMELVGRAENKLAEWEANAKIRRRVVEEKVANMSVEREIKVEDAKTGSTIKDIDRDGLKKDMDVQHDDLKRKMDMSLESLERIKKMKAQEKREEMNIETERLERLSKLGVEALISGSDAEQAKILADLKKTETLKGMTEEQILAMGAANSPALAAAFQEKFKGLSAAKQEELYQEMMKQKDTSMKTMQEMFNKALETQRDATVGVAQGGKVVYPPFGQSGYPGPAGPGGPGFYNVNMGAGGGETEVEIITCKNCGKKIKLKSGKIPEHCPHCGLDPTRKEE